MMLLRLQNRWQAETLSGENCPFADVSDWARGCLEYAAQSGLVQGRSEGFFDAKSDVTAAEYLTMVLRALSYHTETEDTYEKDFDWDQPWLLSDRIGLTEGEYGENTTDFTRGDMARISARALDCAMNGYESFTMFDHICEEGLRGVENEKELYAGLYSDGEKLYESPRLRMISAEFWGSERLYVLMDDLYLLLAAATDALSVQDDGSVGAAYTLHPSDRGYDDLYWVRDYGGFGLEHYTAHLSMSHEGRYVGYSLPYDGAHVRTWGPEDEPVLREEIEPGGLYLSFCEKQGGMGGIPGTMNFSGGVSLIYYGEYGYINDDNPNLDGYTCGYPVFVSADDFLAYFGFDCTLELNDSADGLVWSLAALS
ncbi:MAG: hypothetical protein NC319_07430 [Butyricicoccus sp.]|nr:hypothetical protein [Butyricicoccus sp.]